jgi:peptide chain release factor 1
VRIGERSDKRRTYNFQRDEVVDHRLNIKVRGVRAVLDGNLGELIEAASREDEQKRLIVLGEEK